MPPKQKLGKTKKGDQKDDGKKKRKIDPKTCVHVVYAGFGDACILECQSDNSKRFYLVDGGPVEWTLKGERVEALTKPKRSKPYYQYLLYALTSLTQIPDTTGIKLDGALVTHPDADHLDGVERLFRLLLPPKYQVEVTKDDPDKRLICNGPVLLTKKFSDKAYGSFSDFLLNSEFEIRLDIADILNAFENEMVFTFPSSPGVLYQRRQYTKQDPYSKDEQEKKLKGCVDDYKGPDAANKSSILLYTEKGGKICLNGDAHGYDIAAMLVRENAKDLDIFKLSHHGSPKNSILRKVSPPPWVYQNLAAMILLSIGLNKPTLFPKKPEEERDINSFRSQMKSKIPNHKNGVTLPQVADAFLKEIKKKLKNKKTKPEDFLNEIKEKYEEILAAIQVPTKKDNPYQDLKALQQLADWDKLMKDVASTLSLEKVTLFVRSVMGKDKIFTEYFNGKVGIVPFFESFHSKTYYVSANDRHGHPDSQVIKGIIKAAVKKKKSCRIVFTSRGAVPSTDLPDANDQDKAFKNWTKLVYLYYLKDNVSFKLDPTQDIKTAPEGTAMFTNDDTVRTNVTKQLEENYGFTIPHRTFLPSLDKYYVEVMGGDYWLHFETDGSLSLSSTKSAIVLSNAKTFQGDLRVITLEKEHQNDDDNDDDADDKTNSKATKNDGKKTTKQDKKTTEKTKKAVKKAIQKNVWLESVTGGGYLIRESDDGNYFADENGSLKTTSDIKEAAIFSFKHTTFSALYAPENEENVFISLMEFLKKSHGHQSDQTTINVKTILETLLGVPNIKLLVTSLPSDFIGIKALNHDVALESSMVELSVDHKVISSKIEVVVTTPSMTFNSNPVTKLEIVTKDLSSKPTLTLLVSTSLHHVSYEINISEDLKPRNPSVDMYLNALGDVSEENRDNLTVGTLLQCVMGLLPLETLSNCVPSQLLSNKIFTWKVNRFLSTVNYFVSPLAVEVLSGDFYIVIPPQMNQISFEDTISAEFSNIHVMVKDPRTEKSDLVIECDATIGSVSVNLKIAPTSTNLPEVIISFPEKATVTSVFNILGLEDSIRDLSIPLVNKAIRSLQLFKPKICVAQDVQGYKVMRISSLSFQFSFDNFASVLPSALSSFKESKASVTIFNPLSSHLQLGFEVEFKLPVSSSQENEFLSSKFTLWPVDTSNSMSSDGYACTISLLPSHSRISIESTLQAVGLGQQMSSMSSSFPFLSKLLDGILLKEMSLEVNSQKQSVETFSLSLSVPKCSIVEGKLTMQNGNFLVQYGCGQWYAKADMELLVFNKFVCSAAFSLPKQDEPGSLTIENVDDSLTISAFLKGIGIAVVDDVPIINEVLDVSISRAALTCENEESSFKLTNIEVVIRKRFLTVGSIHLYNLELGICYANVQGSHSVSLSLEGYLNSKTHASFTYDAEQRELAGHYIVIEKTSTAECMGDLFAKQMKDFSSSSAFQQIKTLHVQEVKVILDFPRGKEWFLKEFLVNIEGSLSLGPFNLQQLRLVYKKVDEDDEVKRDVSVEGHFKSDDESVSFMVELSCTSKEAKATTFSALIKPDIQGGLTLSSLLKVLGLPIQGDDVPQVNGSPDFLNIHLKEAFLQFEVSPFRIRKLDIAVQTTTTIPILEKPLIQLLEARLEYHFDGTKDPSQTEIFIAGHFVIAKFGLAVTLKKDAEQGLVLEGRFIEAKGSRKIDFEKAAKQLSPDVPFSLAKNVALTSLLFKLEKKPQTTCIQLEGESQTNWTIDAGFSKITIKNLGGKLDYTRKQSSKAWTGSVYLTGSISLQGIPVTVGIYHDSKDGTIVLGDVNEPKKVDLNAMTQKFAAGPDSSKTWKALVPKESKTAILSPEFTSALLLVNFTEKNLLFYGSVEGFGTGLLMVKKTDTKENSSKYGFLFGLSLGDDFRFSAIDQSFSVVDEVITVEHANLSVISMEQVTIKEIIADFSKLREMSDKETEGDEPKTGQEKDDSSKPQEEGDKQEDVNVPFTDLDDQSISEQEVKRGMTAVAKIKFCDGNSRLLSNVSQIQEEDKKTEIVLFGHIAEKAEDTVFMATIKEMTLFGGHLLFNEISLEYQPSKGKTFTLDGSLSLMLTDDSNPIVFSGSLKISELKADFSMKVGSKPGNIHAPFGMFGISFEDPQLHLSWQFDQDNKKNGTKKRSTLPICSISGTVKFSKSDSTSKKEPVTLKGSILFHGGKPEVAMISFQPSQPLSVDDLFFTLFGNNWPSGYLDISFKEGEIYYAKEQVELNGKTYEKGFRGKTDIEIFGHSFGVCLSVDKKGFKVEGYTEFEIDLDVATLAGKDFKEDKGPKIDISRYEGDTTFELSAGVKILQEKIGSCSVGYDITQKCFIGEVTYSGELLGFTNPSIEFEWSHKKEFKIRKWPANLDLGERINFAEEFTKLSQMDKGPCEKLVGLAFHKVIKTKCKVHLEQASPDTSKDPKAWFAVKVQGSIDIMIVTDDPVLTVDFPELTVSVTKPKSGFRLSDLPEFLLDEIAKNSLNIVKQVFDHPKQLTKFMAALGGIKLSRKVISGLICRGCESENVTEQAETECKKMQKETEEDEGDLDDALDTLTEAAEAGADLADLAADAEAVFDAAGPVLAALAGFISFLAGIITFFTGKSKEQKEAEKRRDQAKEKKKRARKIVEDRLAITGLSMSLPREDEVDVTWDSLEQGVKYNVTLSRIDVGGEMTSLLSTTTEENKVKVKSDEVKFDNNQFIARVQAIYKDFKGDTKEVSKTVTPLLPPPSKIEVESKRDGREVDVTFSLVKSATEYKVQVVNHPHTVIGSTIVKLSSKDKEGKHVFNTEDLKPGDPGKTQVGVCALQKDDGPQEFKYSSTELYLVEAPSHVDFSYEVKLQQLSVKWKVTDIQKISGYVCEIQSVQGNDVVFSKDITKPKGDTTLESNVQIQLTEIPDRAKSPYCFRVRSLGEQATLASVFVNSKDQFSFLPKVQDISPLYDPKTNQLTVSWSPLQGVTKYEVSILKQMDNSNVASKSTPDGKTCKVVFKMDLVELKCEDKYVVSVIAEGSDALHLPSTPSTATAEFALLPKPASVSQAYSFKEKTVKVTFKPVPQAETHLIEIFNEKTSTEIEGRHVVSKPADNWPSTMTYSIDVGVFKPNDTGPFKSRVIAEGSTTQWINSLPCVTATELKRSEAPTSVALTYNIQTKELEVVISSKPGQFIGTVEDTAHKDKQISKETFVVKQQTNEGHSVGTTTQWKIPLNPADKPQGAKYQAAIVNDGDQTYLPSVVKKSNEVLLLDPPASVTQQCDQSGRVLTVAWRCVQSAAGYSIKVYNTKTDSIAAEEEITSALRPAGEEMKKEFSLESLLLQSSGLYQALVMVMGDKFSIGGASTTSSSSISSCPSPSDVSITFDNDTRHMGVSCSPVTGAVSIKLGVIDSEKLKTTEGNVQKALLGSKVVTCSSDDGKSVVEEIAIDDSVLFKSHDTVYKGVAQILGVQGKIMLPSGFSISSDQVVWLKQATPIHISYDPQTSNVKVTWTTVEIATGYVVKIRQTRNEGDAEYISMPFKRVMPRDAVSCSFNIGNITFKEVDWLDAIVVPQHDLKSAIAIDSSGMSVETLVGEDSPFNVEVSHVDDETVSVSWDAHSQAMFQFVVWKVSGETEEQVITKEIETKQIVSNPRSLGLSSPGCYKFGVRAYGSVHKLPSAYAKSDFCAVIMDAPSALLNSNSVVTLQWHPVKRTPAQDFSHYIIWCRPKRDEHAEWKREEVDLSVTEKTITNLQPNEDFLFCISVASVSRGDGIRSQGTTVRVFDKVVRTPGNLLDSPNFEPIGNFDEGGNAYRVNTDHWELEETSPDSYRLERSSNEPDTKYRWNIAVANTATPSRRKQTIDLLAKGVNAEYLDEVRPTIETYEWFAINSAGRCEIKVTLLDDSQNELQGQEPFSKQITIRNGDGSWQRLEHTFADYGPGLRFIRFEDSLEGLYIDKMGYDVRAFAATVKFSQSPSTSYEMMVNEQINFSLQTMYKFLYMSSLKYADRDLTHQKFSLLSDRSRCYFSLAEELMRSQWEQEKRIVLRDIKKPDMGHSTELVKACETALALAKETDARLNKFRQAAVENDDQYMVQQIDQFLHSQTTFIVNVKGLQREVKGLQPDRIRLLKEDRGLEVSANLIDYPNFEANGSQDFYDDGLYKYCVDALPWVMENTHGCTEFRMENKPQPGIEEWPVQDTKYPWNIAIGQDTDVCKRVQTIDLLAKGFTAEHLDEARSSIEAYEWFAFQEGGGFSYEIKVSLLDKDKNELPEQQPFTQRQRADSGKPGSWRRLGHTFIGYPPGLRFIRFESGCLDGHQMKIDFDLKAYEPTVKFSESTEYERAINEQINFEMQTAYELVFMASLTEHTVEDMNRLLMDQSHQLWFAQAVQLMDFQEKRGKSIVLQDIKKPDAKQLGSSLTGAEAREAALKLAKQIKTRLTQLRNLAENKKDPEMVDFIGKCLQKQQESIEMLSGRHP